MTNRISSFLFAVISVYLDDLSGSKYGYTRSDVYERGAHWMPRGMTLDQSYQGLPMEIPGIHFNNAFGAKNGNLEIFHYALFWKIIIQSSQNFAHAMTAEPSWHVQNSGSIPSFVLKTQQYIIVKWGSWAPQLLVKRTLHLRYYGNHTGFGVIKANFKISDVLLMILEYFIPLL